MNTDRLHNHYGTEANTTAHHRTRRRPSGRNAGSSLVEVLIVLVVILIGVFAIIQIFPIGFNTLKKSEARLRADRLARNVTESLSVDANSLPESISFSYYDGAGIRQTVTSEDPDDLKTYQDDPGNRQYFSDVNKYRYITNEPIRIPLPTATSGTGFGSGVGSIHFLTFGPVFMDTEVGDPTSVPTAAKQPLYDSYLKITSESLIGIAYDSNNGDNTSIAVAARRLTGANTYLIDYGDDNSGPFILFTSSSKPRVFTVTYSYEDDSVSPAEIKSASTEITVAANTQVWNALGTKNILAGSERVLRNFTRIASGDAWDPTEPYQYKLVSSNVTGAATANLGVVAFNPAGANFSVAVPGGTKPFTALASYAVLDWHILHDDREVPEGGKVRTSLPGIRPKGEEYVDLNATGTNRTQVYAGLYPQSAIYRPGEPLPSDADSPDIQVINLSPADGTAKILTGGDLAKKTTTDANADYWVNKVGSGGTYPTGTIYINTNRVSVGSKVRILYKAEGDWAVSFQKAASAYKFNTAALPTGNRPVDNTVESFAIDRESTSSDFTDDRIYFHRSELNKGVTAAFEVQTATTTTRLPARQFSINTADDIYSYASLSAAVPEIKGNKFNGVDVTGVRVLGDVNGASLKTRVIWQDEQNGRNPWRMADLETFVTRQAQ